MRTWERATVATTCGGPRDWHRIAAGEPMQKITLVGVRVLFRCVLCADEPAPVDLPKLVAATPLELHGFTSIADRAKVARVRFDYKRAQAGEEG